MKGNIMGWEKGRYYTRSRKVNGRVVREYVGGGEVGAMAARVDAINRERRHQERESWRLEQEEMDTIDASVANVCQMAREGGTWGRTRERLSASCGPFQR